MNEQEKIERIKIALDNHENIFRKSRSFANLWTRDTDKFASQINDIVKTGDYASELMLSFISHIREDEYTFMETVDTIAKLREEKEKLCLEIRKLKKENRSLKKTNKILDLYNALRDIENE